MKRRPRKLPPLNALRAFEAAARHLSFKRAAAELAVTPAAVSHQVRALEAQLGVELFARGHRALALTRAGARSLPGLTDAFDALDDAVHALRARSAPPRLVLSVVPSFGANWLVPRLGAFRAKHRAIDLVVLSSAELVDFARDPVDVGIRFGPGGWPGVRADLLLGEEYVAVASPKLARGARGLRSPEDLRRHTLLHDENSNAWRAWLDGRGSHRRRPRARHRVLRLESAGRGRRERTGRGARAQAAWPRRICARAPWCARSRGACPRSSPTRSSAPSHAPTSPRSARSASGCSGAARER